MTPQDFHKLQEQLFTELRQLHAIKSGEYASDADKLANFRAAGLRQSLLPEQVLLVYLDKHFAAICNYIQDLTRNISRPRSESIHGRIRDGIVYLILLEALLVERRELGQALDEAETPRRLRWDFPEDAA